MRLGLRGIAVGVLVLWAGLVPAIAVLAPRVMERLDRGVVAVPQADGSVYVGWRLLATDPEGVAFNLYRGGPGQPSQRLNETPLAVTTDYLDRQADLSAPVVYRVRPVLAGTELPDEGAFALPAAPPRVPYLSIPVQTPDGYHPNDASVGDLDGDGRYEVVVHLVGKGGDVGADGPRTEPIFDAYRLDGTRLWRVNLGRNVREGPHYTPFVVYDLDGDGRAEMACRTADGTVDGQGAVLGDPQADWRNDRGVILRGPEFLTVFDGQTGRALATTAYIPPRHPTHPLAPSPQQIKEVWGDDYGNRSERYLACAAYLDGVRPSLVMCRGYYTRSVLAAWDWRDGRLTQRWVFDSADGTPGHAAYAGQGTHSLSVADVDADGRDEIVYGSCTLDDDGHGLYTTGLGHGDALHVTDLDPDRPGLEIWQCHESGGQGATLRDARTGEVLFQRRASRDMGRACAGDLLAESRGCEVWGAAGCPLLTCKGVEIGPAPRPINFVVWWDGDLLRELLDGTTITKYGGPVLLSAEGCAANNSTKATPCLQADILGDWREEVLWRTADNRSLRLYTTTLPARQRLPTLMHDPQYRLSIAWQNAGYNQPPHPGFYLGEGMASPSRSGIIPVGP